MKGLRKCTEPGKFEGELLIAKPLYQLSLDGGCDEEAGDVSENGCWYGLLRGPFDNIDEIEPGVPLTKEEREFLGRIAGAIICETDTGFVYVSCYEDHAELERVWEELLEEELDRASEELL